MHNLYQSPARRRAVGFVCLAGPGLVSLVAIAVSPAMPAMAAYFAPGESGTLFAQMIMTLPAIMMIIGAPLMGFIAERIGRRAVLILSLLLYVSGGSAGLFLSDYTTLVVMRLLLGLAAGGIMTSFLALIGEYYEDHARERMLGYASAISGVAAVLALVAGGLLVDAAGWRAPFAFYLLGLLVLPAAWYGIHPGRSKQPAVRVLQAAHERNGSLWSVWPFYALMFLFTIGMYTPSVQVPFLLEAKGVMSAGVHGAVVAVSSLVAALGAFGYGYMRRFWGERTMYFLTASATGIGIIALGLSESTWAIVGALVPVGILMATTDPTTASAIMKRTPDALHDRGMGLLVSALFLGQFANPWVFDPLRRAFGVQQAFVIVGCGFLALALVILAQGFFAARLPEPFVRNES
jgi:MFS family permease